MKTVLRSGLALVGLVGGVACGGSERRMEPQVASETTTTGALTASVAIGDDQIAAVLAAANRGELEQARLATERAKDSRVRRFAAEVATDDDAAEERLGGIETGVGVTPHEGPTSDELKDDCQHAVISLRSESSAAFDRTYVDAQIDQQQKVLTLIARLVPEAKNAQLRSELEECRSRVAAHLQHARDVQSALEEE